MGNHRTDFVMLLKSSTENIFFSTYEIIQSILITCFNMWQKK